MKAILNLFFYTLILCMPITSCKYDDVGNTTDSITIEGGSGVYVVGYEWNKLTNNVAMCWEKWQGN